MTFRYSDQNPTVIFISVVEKLFDDDSKFERLSSGESTVLTDFKADKVHYMGCVI